MSNLRKKLAGLINCVGAEKDTYGYTYILSGITEDELKNNFEAHKDEIKSAIVKYTIDALPTNKNELLDYWVLENYDAEILSQDSLDKVENNSEYDTNPGKLFEDFKNEIVPNVTEAINMLCDEGYNDESFRAE